MEDRRTTDDRRSEPRENRGRRSEDAMCYEITSSSEALPRLLTVDEVCFILQIDVRTVDKMDLPWVIVRPNKRRLKPNDLNDFVERNRLKTRELQ